MILSEYGLKGKQSQPQDYRFLYHLCDHHSYAYSMENNVLRSRSNALSTTWDPTMNHVVGRSHLSFKFVLDCPSLVAKYGAHSYDDRGYVGSKLTSHNEREVRIETKEVEPLAKFHLGTCVMFDLFSEAGVQWLLYRNGESKSGFMSQSQGAAKKSIFYIYQQIATGKPMWLRDVGRNLKADEMRFLDEVRTIAEQDLPFYKELELVSDIVPLRDHRGKVVDRETWQRRHMAPTIVKMLNKYYAGRPARNVDVAYVRKLIGEVIDILRVSSNFKAFALSCIDENKLFDIYTAPVQWGAIIQAIMDYDSEEVADACKFFGDENEHKRKYLGAAPEYMTHSGTMFGRGASQD